MFLALFATFFDLGFLISVDLLIIYIFFVVNRLYTLLNPSYTHSTMIRLAIYIFLSLLVVDSIAQDRPKVGLVLSGGSAHGIAHIGVIRYLEEQGIPVDYVTGTSMGAIVGGLYAMGLTADDMEKVAMSHDWSQLLTNSTPLYEIAPSEKQFHDRFALRFTIHDGEVKLPQGFISGQKLDLLLSQLYSGSYFLEHFDDLPRPFRCAAVDIETGEVKLFDQGYLGQAIRASMAIPSVFQPMEIDGRLYVDGGLIRNFPVEENRALGADIIIGVYVGGKLEERDDLRSLIDILGQSAFMMGILDSEQQKKKVDILIEPDVKDLPSFGFDLTEELIEQGYRSAKTLAPAIDSLKTIINSPDIGVRNKIRNPDAYKISKVSFPLTEEPFDKLARFKFGPVRTRSYRIPELEKAINRIYGTKHFENIRYDLDQRSDGSKEISVIAVPKVGTDLHANVNYLPTTGTSFILHGEIRNMLGVPSVLHSTVRLSEKYGVALQYDYRLGDQKDYLFTVGSSINKFDQYNYDLNLLRDTYTAVNTRGNVRVAYEPNNTMWVGAGVDITNNSIKPDGTDVDRLKSYSRINLAPNVFGEFNNLNKHGITHQGWRLKWSLGYHHLLSRSISGGANIAEFIPEDQSYVKGDVRLQRFQPLIPQITLIAHAERGYKSQLSFGDNYRIGGLEYREENSVAAIGMDTDQFQLRHYTKLGGELRFRLLPDLYFSFLMDRIAGERAFQMRDAANLMEEIEFYSYGAKFSLDTPIGSIQLAHGKNTFTDTWNTNFTIGYAFF